MVVDDQGHDEAQEAVVQRIVSRLPHASANCWKTPSKEGLLELDTDKRSRTYVVTRFGSEMNGVEEGEAAPARKKTRRRRSGAKRRVGAPVPAGDEAAPVATADHDAPAPTPAEPPPQEPAISDDDLTFPPSSGA